MFVTHINSPSARPFWSVQDTTYPLVKENEYHKQNKTYNKQAKK